MENGSTKKQQDINKKSRVLVSFLEVLYKVHKGKALEDGENTYQKGS